MFIQKYNKRKGIIIYYSAFLVENHRDVKNVKHLHLANLSAIPTNLLATLRLELKGKTTKTVDELEIIQVKSCGGGYLVAESVWCLQHPQHLLCSFQLVSLQEVGLHPVLSL